MAPFLEELQGLRPVNKVAGAFGSYGWGGGAMRTIEEKLGKAGIKMAVPTLAVKWVPDKDEIRKCIELGKDIAKKGQLYAGSFSIEKMSQAYETLYQQAY